MVEPADSPALGDHVLFAGLEDSGGLECETCIEIIHYSINVYCYETLEVLWWWRGGGGKRERGG